MERLAVTFTGDIGFDHYMAGKWQDPELISEELLNIFNASDEVVINVEAPLVGSEASFVEAKEMRLMHTMDPAAVSVFERMNSRIWNLCNNHIMDAGPEGLKATLDLLRELGVQKLGVGMNETEASESVIIDKAGGVGFFSAGYQRGCKPAGPDKAGCLNWADFGRIQETIDHIRSKCRWCVMVVHGGEEFTSLPSPYVRDRYLRFLDMGADIIVCHHPHVPMNYEMVGSKAIFYSLGNFIFDTDYQRAQFNTEKGIVLTLEFTEDSWNFKAQGIRIDREKERVVPDRLPGIFENVPEEEYKKLAPLSAKAFVEATKRQQIFLYPDRYKNADRETWKENFFDPKRSGRVPGEALDFQIIVPFSQEAEKGGWKESKLEGVKEYILKQLSDRS